MKSEELRWTPESVQRLGSTSDFRVVELEPFNPQHFFLTLEP